VTFLLIEDFSTTREGELEDGMHSQSIVHRVRQLGQCASLQDCRANVGLHGFLRSSIGGVASGCSGSFFLSFNLMSIPGPKRSI
jgi:hypothetical protein